MAETEKEVYELSLFQATQEKLQEMEFTCFLLGFTPFFSLPSAMPRDCCAFCTTLAHICPHMFYSCEKVLRKATSIGCKRCHVFCKKCLRNHCQETIKKKLGKLICPKCPKNEGLVRTWFIKTCGSYVGEYGWEDSTRPGYPIKPAALVERQMGKLQIECERKEKGCAWIGCFKEKQKHNQKDCEYRGIKCSFERCTEVYMQKYIKHHLQNCQFRPVKCPKCG